MRGRAPTGSRPRSPTTCSSAKKGDLPDGAYFAIISGGSDVKPIDGRTGDPGGGMAAFGGQLKTEEIWSIIAWIRNQQGHEAAEGHTEPPAPKKK